MAAMNGELPAAVNPSAVTRVVWVAADRAAAAQIGECRLRLPHGWSCDTSSPDGVGVVVIETDVGIAFVVAGATDVVASGIASWGKMIRVSGANDEPGVRAAALKINRPAARPNTRVLDVEADGDVQISPIGGASFWITGTERSPDSFIRFASERSATHDEPVDLIAGDAAVALDIALQSPVSLEGRVETESGAAVSGALVDLFAVRPGMRVQSTPETLKAAEVVRVAEARTNDDGWFAIQGLEPHIYKVAVVDFERGRSDQWTEIAGAPLTIRLKTPSKATGRVLRKKAPVAGTVVRFIPDAAAWRESGDPAAHLTLDSSSDDEGRFSLQLPPEADGTVQLTAPDGASKRVRLPHVGKTADIVLGDIALSDPIDVEIQTDAGDCVISAVGPAGAGGFSIVRSKSDGVVHALALPEAGQWLLQVECGGMSRRMAPSSLDVSAKGELSTHTFHVE